MFFFSSSSSAVLSVKIDLQMASTQTTSNATKPTAPSGGESKRKGQQETFMAGSSAKQKKEKSGECFVANRNDKNDCFVPCPIYKLEVIKIPIDLCTLP